MPLSPSSSDILDVATSRGTCDSAHSGSESAVMTVASDAMTDLLRLVEREHQRIDSMELEVAELRAQLAVEHRRSQVLFARVNSVEMD